MNKKVLFRIALLSILAFFSWLMLRICLQYVPINFDIAFLRIKQQEIKLVHYQIAFFTHVYSSLFTLLAGFTQFSTWFRTKYARWHRLIGQVYISVILFLAGPSGLVLAYYAKGGIWPQISFTILSVLWLVYTYVAFRKAVSKDFNKHRQYMYYSYALTLSAISLRLWKWLIANTLALPPHQTYILVSWLAWTLNLMVAFFVFRIKQRSLPLSY